MPGDLCHLRRHEPMLRRARGKRRVHVETRFGILIACADIGRAPMPTQRHETTGAMSVNRTLSNAPPFGGINAIKVEQRGLPASSPHQIIKLGSRRRRALLLTG